LGEIEGTVGGKDILPARGTALPENSSGPLLELNFE